MGLGVGSMLLSPVQSCKLWSACLALYTNWMSGLSALSLQLGPQGGCHAASEGPCDAPACRVKAALPLGEEGTYLVPRFQTVRVLTWIENWTAGVLRSKSFSSSPAGVPFRLAQSVWAGVLWWPPRWQKPWCQKTPKQNKTKKRPLTINSLIWTADPPPPD